MKIQIASTQFKLYPVAENYKDEKESINKKEKEFLLNVQ